MISEEIQPFATARSIMFPQGGAGLFPEPSAELARVTGDGAGAERAAEAR